MKKSAILALIALASSATVYAGIGNKKSKQKEKEQTECCDKTTCCPSGTTICK